LQQSKTSLVKGHFWFPKNFANKNPLKSKKTKRLVFFLETLKCFSQICLRPEIPRIAADKAFCWNYRKICYPAMHEPITFTGIAFGTDWFFTSVAKGKKMSLICF